MTLFLLLILAYDFPVDGVVLAAPAIESGNFITSPADMAIDENGHIYILDIEVGTVFHWDAAGKYLGHHGAMGEGPGEFRFFASSGGPHGYLAVNDHGLFVYEAHKEISRFDKSAAYQGAFNLEIPQGRVNFFRMTSNGRLIIANSSYFSDNAYVAAGIYDQKGKPVKELAREKDLSWRITGSGDNERMVRSPYTSRLIVGYDDPREHIMVGRSENASFDIFDMNGKKLKTVSYKTPRIEVSEEDKQAYLDRPYMKNKYFRFEFADYKQYYNQIIPLEDNRYLMFLKHDFEALGYGVLIDEQ